MKQVININFHGTVVPIETTAYDMLKSYIASLNKHFANEEGKEEIINDIESRIAELFQERLKKGATCITDDDVNAVINSMGRVEDFEKEEGTTATSTESNKQQHQQTSNSYTQSTGTKRLYRDENHKTIGGVCSGLANYFNIDVVIARIIFVVSFFLGFGFITYIIMWITVPSSATQQIGSTRKKLFRDTDDKLLAGVCSGIGNYFGINAWIPRVLFLIPFISFFSRWGHWGGLWDFGDVVRFTFSPTSLIIYIILWIVIPEALSTSEKLEMKGEKVDVDSIKNSVMEEMKTVGKKAQTYGSEIGSTVTQKANAMADDVKTFAKKNRGGLGDVIAMIVKIIAYFIIGCVCFGLVIALFTLGIFSIGVFPFKDYLLRGGWQNTFAWGTLLFFITVPIIGVITWLIRKITKSKSNSKMLRLTFGSLWVLGWVCFIMLITTVSRDFKSSSNLSEQYVSLTNPKVSKMVVTSSLPFNKKYYRRNWTRFEPFDNFIDEDTAFVRNIEVAIAKSTNDSFQVSILKLSRGNKKANANELAEKINFAANQMDSLLILDKGIAIDKISKFRNQSVLVTIYVPIGKQIKINKGIGWPVHFYGSKNWDDWDNDYIEFEENEKWQTDVDYIMKADGLYTLTGKRADGWNDKKNSKVKITKNGIDVEENGTKTHIGPDGIKVDETEDTYRYNNDGNSNNKQDSIKQDAEKKKKALIDSIDKQTEKRIKGTNVQKEINQNIELMQAETSSSIPGLLVTPFIN